MAAHELTTEPQGTQVRIAARGGVCGADGCRKLIEPGHLIIKPPGRGWRHLDCSDPGRSRRRNLT